MFNSDFLSRFSSDNNDEEPIPYLTDTSLLNNASYMTQLDAICKFNYNMGQGVCTSHSFPIRRSQAKMQKIAIPSLFKPSTDRPDPAAKGSVLRDPPAVFTRKRSMTLPPLDVSQTAPEKRRCGRPPKKRAIEPMLTLPEATDIETEDLNDSLPTFYPVRHRRRQPTPSTPQTVDPPEPAQFSDNETALKQIHTRNIQDNLDLTCRTAPTRTNNINNIPKVTETLQPVNMDRHFPCLLQICTDYSKDLQLKTCQDVLHQKVINKIVDQLNSKTMHF